METAYSADQADVLTEVVNIAMGQAADSLARLLDSFVQLPVPRVRLVLSQDIPAALIEMVGGATHVTAVRQGFSSHLQGEAIVIFGAEGCSDLGDLLGYDSLEGAAEEELILDVSNLLVGACLRGIAEQLSYDLSFSPPSIMGRHIEIAAVVDPKTMPWEQALLVEVNFRIENRAFVCHVLVFWPGEAIAQLRRAIDQIMDGINEPSPT